MSTGRSSRWVPKFVFLASPGDLSRERELFPAILDKLNEIKAHGMGIHLAPTGWEKTSPGFGRAQSLINENVDDCDLFLMLLWKRWGIPPGAEEYSSGTQEEFERASALRRENGSPEIQLYFRDVAQELLADPGPQLAKVLAFRKRIEEERVLLYSRYSDPAEWQNKLEIDISRWLDKLNGVEAVNGSAAPARTTIASANPTRPVEANSEERARHRALQLAKEAALSASKGLMTDAEELYAKAIQTYPDLSVISELAQFYLQHTSEARAEMQFSELLLQAVRQGDRAYIQTAVRMLDQIASKSHANPRTAREIIRQKALGLPLARLDIDHFVQSATRFEMSGEQTAALLMAIFLRGLNLKETKDLIEAMADSGEVLDLSEFKRPKVDKHSTGGVGDKTSMIVAPAAAAGGCIVPMLTGRGLGYAGGTLDKLESIPGMSFPEDMAQIKLLLRGTGLVFASPTRGMVPADRVFYAMRDLTSTVESFELICSSILSKKLAEGIDALVVDVKFGHGAFMKDIESGRYLARSFVDLGSLLNMKVDVVMTRADQPFGLAIGNGLEVLEAVSVLKGGGPEDVVMLSRELTAQMFVAGAIDTSLALGRRRFDDLISSGRALKKFRDCIAAQGGDADFIDDPEKLGIAPVREEICAPGAGYISELRADALGMAVLLLGGGRERAGDALDHKVGIVLKKKIGDFVQANEPLCVLHAHETSRVEEARKLVLDAARISEEPVQQEGLRIEHVEVGILR